MLVWFEGMWKVSGMWIALLPYMDSVTLCMFTVNTNFYLQGRLDGAGFDELLCLCGIFIIFFLLFFVCKWNYTYCTLMWKMLVQLSSQADYTVSAKKSLHKKYEYCLNIIVKKSNDRILQFVLFIALKYNTTINILSSRPCNQ